MTAPGSSAGHEKGYGSLPRRDLDVLKSSVSLLDLALETHPVDRQGKVLCPVHDDHHPSCQLFPDNHFHCFVCGAHGDAFDWLEQVHGLDFAGAVAFLERRAGAVPASTTNRRREPAAPQPKPTPGPLPAGMVAHHRRLAARLDRVPAALEGRHLALSDLRALGIARDGDDALIPISDLDGQLVAVKRRLYRPRTGQRYIYTSKGVGSPAWCSENVREADGQLVVEGELNAARAALAAPHLGVQGVAGAGSLPYLDVLAGKLVYLYSDDDRAGDAARRRWAALATGAGARAVYVLEPLPAGLDFCDISPADLRGFLS